VAALAAIGALILVGSLVLGRDDDPTARNSVAPPNAPVQEPAGTTGTTAPRRGPVDRGATTVFVLNGTSVPNLARAALTKLQEAGFKEGGVATATVQTRSATLIQFAEGKRREAEEVARLIQEDPREVRPIDPGVRAIAGEESAVVVTVGSDKAS